MAKSAQLLRACNLDKAQGQLFGPVKIARVERNIRESYGHGNCPGPMQLRGDLIDGSSVLHGIRAQGSHSQSLIAGWTDLQNSLNQAQRLLLSSLNCRHPYQM